MVEDKGWFVWVMTKMTGCGLSAVWVVWVFSFLGGYECTRFGLVWVVFWLGEGSKCPNLVVCKVEVSQMMGLNEVGFFGYLNFGDGCILCLFQFWL